jgi:YD repeat-containing protein
MNARMAMRGLVRLCMGVLLAAVAVVGVSAPVRAQAAAYTTGFRWDAERRLVGTISPDPDGPGVLLFPAVRYSYDGDGKLVLIEKGTLGAWQAEAVVPAAWPGFTALETTSFAYDAVGNAVEQRLTTAAGGGAVQTVTQTIYDADDRPACTAVRMNMAAIPAAGSDACAQSPTPSPTFGADRITKTVYDAANETIQIRRGVGTGLEQADVTYSYTANGKQDYVIDANGNRAELLWDGFDRQAQWQFPSPTRPSAFDPSTQLTALATAGAVNTADYELYGYDASGNRTSLRKRGTQTLTFTFDALNRMTVKTVPANGAVAGYSVNYGYDLVGHQLSASFGPSGLGIINQYDKADRLTQSSSNAGGTTRTLAYLYDANGNRIRVTHPDGGPNPNFFTTDYDALNRAITITENGATVLASIGYTDLGLRGSLNRGSGAVATTYTPDAASRLGTLLHDLPGAASDVSLGLGYNPAGQIVGRTTSNDAFAYTEQANTARSYTSNGLNQYSQVASIGAALPAYDANGNMTADGRGTAYAYDSENRLVSANGMHTASLSYDPLGRLLRTDGNATTQFLYDGDALVAEYDGTGALARRYVHGPGVDEPIVWYEGSAVSAASGLR